MPFMAPHELISEIKRKRSCLCVGLDTDLKLIPPHLLSKEDPVFEFNKAIIEATSDYAVAYKPNLAFYEAMGPPGWESLRKTLEIIPRGIMKLADAKRGDIGNTATQYAEAFFSVWGFDAITVAPYMGKDSVVPFLKFPGKWVFLLALTSNPGANDFQFMESGGEKLFERVVSRSREWAKSEPGELGFVTGATRPEQILNLRQHAPDNFFLVPGVGVQGGSLEDVCQNGLTRECGLLINSSRGIIYASNEKDFAEKANIEAAKAVAAMLPFLAEKGLQ